jgi:acyl-CoA dehydrogenase
MSEMTSIGDMLANQVDRLLEDRVDHALLMAVEEGTFPTALWAALDGLGVGDAMVPEDAGGAALPWRDMERLFHCLGARSAPVPLAETIIGRWILATAGVTVPEGALAVVAEPLTLDAAGRLSGRLPLVPWLPGAAHAVAVAAGEDGGARVCLVAAADVAAEPVGWRATIGRLPGAAVDFTGVTPLHVAEAAALPGAAEGLATLAPLAVLRAVQMVGCLETALALCVDYAGTRQQFGRPLNKFQAIQHLIAELAELTAAAKMAARLGCIALDRGDARFGPAVAKSRAGQSATRGAAIAHQIFGAIGVTDEHSLHFLTRRLWQWRGEAGSEHWWAERLGREAIAAGGEHLWTTLTVAV